MYLLTRYLASMALIGSLLFLTTPFAFTCTLALPSIKEFDKSEYIFIGKVIGIAGPLESNKLQNKAWGLTIEVSEKVYLPKTAGRYFDVFPYELWADCSIDGTHLEKLIREFPTGSNVRVIARESKIFPNKFSPQQAAGYCGTAGEHSQQAAGHLPAQSKLDKGNIRLEVMPGSLGSISRNFYEDGRLMTSSSSVFDYKNYQSPTPEDYVREFMPFIDAQVVLPEFELRKDLLRLKNSRTQDERLEIIQRLLYYPDCCYLDFNVVAKTHVKHSKLLQTLSARREMWNSRGINRE